MEKNKGQKLYLVGYASGLAGANSQAGNAPACLQHSTYLQSVPVEWVPMIAPPQPLPASMTQAVETMCQQLAEQVAKLRQQHQAVCVLGGDHSSAIGTWSGVHASLLNQGELGLIWIDAHMDSHTPETSETGHIHGMPLACLLGHGAKTLTNIMHAGAKLKPENICLIGVRSYEQGEAEFLQRLKVRVYFMEEVKERGFMTVLREAVHRVTQHTIGYGLTIDVDSLDPAEAPGVDVPEPDGIHLDDLYAGVTEMVADKRLLATEIVEFDPIHDQDHKTEIAIVNLLKIIAHHQQQNSHTH